MRHFIATQAHVYQQHLIGLIYERELILIDWRAVKRLKRQVLTGEDSYRVYVANEAERASLWYSPSQPLFDSLRADFKLSPHPKQFPPACHESILANPRIAHFKRYSFAERSNLYLHSHPRLKHVEFSTESLQSWPVAQSTRILCEAQEWMEKLDTDFADKQCSHPHCCFNPVYNHGLLAAHGAISPYDPNEMLCLEHMGEAIFCQEMLGIRDKELYKAELIGQAHYNLSRFGAERYPFDRIAAGHVLCPGPCATQFIMGDFAKFRINDKYDGCRFTEGTHFLLCYNCRLAESCRTKAFIDATKEALADGQKMTDLPAEDRTVPVASSEDVRVYIHCGHRDINPTTCLGKAIKINASTNNGTALRYKDQWICGKCAALPTRTGQIKDAHFSQIH